jgi:hypothetical protein
MKKVLFVMVLVMAALVVNAQTTRTAVKVADLQKAITDNVAKDYVGFTIKDAVKVTTNNVVTFEVVVTKGTTTETLVYDKDGKFVKKVTKKEGTTVKKEPAKPAAAGAAAKKN